jgi:hypothetical protein
VDFSKLRNDPRLAYLVGVGVGFGLGLLIANNLRHARPGPPARVEVDCPDCAKARAVEAARALLADAERETVTAATVPQEWTDGTGAD